MIESVSHLTFIVEDLERMETLLTTVLDAEKVYDSGEKYFSHSPERFYTIAGQWVAVMQGEAGARVARSYNHIAFKIAPHDYDRYLQRIQSLQLELREGRSRVEGEGDSIYFYDYDNHLFELHTGTLQQRLLRYAEK